MDSELVDVPECLITKREMVDTPVRFPYTLGGACACFLVECTRANSITRPENGEESFETLGFEKNFVRTINNMTQRRNTFRKADEKSRDGSFPREARETTWTRGKRGTRRKERRHNFYAREIAWHFPANNRRALAISRAEFRRDRANVSNLTSLDFHSLMLKRRRIFGVHRVGKQGTRARAQLSSSLGRTHVPSRIGVH